MTKEKENDFETEGLEDKLLAKPVKKEEIPAIEEIIEEEEAILVVRPIIEEEEILVEEPPLIEEVKPLAEAIRANASPDRADFDWSSFEGSKNVYNKAEKEKLTQLYSTTKNEVEEKKIIMARIVSMNDREVIVNLGAKSDGMIPLSEFKHRQGINVGDEVEVIIETKEDKNGQIVVSHKKAQAEHAWVQINKAHEEGTILKGYIKDRTKGGMVVDLMGLDAFLPGSQLDVKPIKDYDSYVGQWLELKVVKVNPIYRNVVVSHKAIIEGDIELQKSEILGRLEKGQVLEGTVKNLTNFGVFVDLGGVDGLIHITDVSWGRINHPEEVLEVGQSVNVVVLDYDDEKKRISLGMKQLTPHPWEQLGEDVVVGSEITGKIVNIEDYGAFVEILSGVEGLIHVSEMSWSTHLKSPNEYVKLGDEIKAKVINIDREERKLSLGLKQLTPDPWENIEEKFAKGTKHKAVIRSMTNFGLFVEVAEGIDGLVHVSDLSWTKKFQHPAEFTKVGETLDVIVLDLDKENRRISLGHKQLEEDPWDTFETIFLEGSIHQGVVSSFDDRGAIISLPYGVEALCTKRNMAKADKSKPKVDETLEFKIVEFDKINRRILLSHTDIWKEEERANSAEADNLAKAEEEKTKKDVKKVKDKVETATLADELDILAQLKTKMEADDVVKQKDAIKKLDAANVAKAEAKIAKAAKTTEEPIAETPSTEEAPTETTAEVKKPARKSAPRKKKAEVTDDSGGDATSSDTESQAEAE